MKIPVLAINFNAIEESEIVTEIGFPALSPETAVYIMSITSAAAMLKALMK